MQDPTTQIMKVSELNGQLSQVIDRVSHREIRVLLVEREGSPVAALVTPAHLSRLEQIERDWDAGSQALELVSEALADVPVDELEEKIAQIIADDRANAKVQRRSA